MRGHILYIRDWGHPGIRLQESIHKLLRTGRKKEEQKHNTLIVMSHKVAHNQNCNESLLSIHRVTNKGHLLPVRCGVLLSCTLP